MYFLLSNQTSTSTSPLVEFTNLNNATTPTSSKSYILSNTTLLWSTALDIGNYSTESSVSLTPISGSSTTTQIQTESSTANSTSGIAITASNASSEAAVTPTSSPANVTTSSNDVTQTTKVTAVQTPFTPSAPTSILKLIITTQTTEKLRTVNPYAQ